MEIPFIDQWLYTLVHKAFFVSSQYNVIYLFLVSEIDVLVGDYNTLVYLAAQDPDCSLRVIGESFFKSGYGIALRKNSTWTSAVVCSAYRGQEVTSQSTSPPEVTS